MNTPGGAKMISYRGWAKFAKFAIAFEEPSKKYPFEFEFLQSYWQTTHTHTKTQTHKKREEKTIRSLWEDYYEIIMVIDNDSPWIDGNGYIGIHQDTHRDTSKYFRKIKALSELWATQAINAMHDPEVVVIGNKWK